MPDSVAEKDLEFIARRRKLVGWWKWIGPGTLLGLAVFLAWMFFSYPMLLNPVHVVGELKAERVEPATMAIMAAMVPVLALTIFFVIAMMILFTFAMIGNERRYLKIIDQLQKTDSPDT